jgi:hypothetical protein
MKTISLHVPEQAYEELKSIAARRQQPVAELIRQAMDDYLQRERRLGRSLLDLPPHPSGPLLEPWTREDLMDEMMDH